MVVTLPPEFGLGPVGDSLDDQHDRGKRERHDEAEDEPQAVVAEEQRDGEAAHHAREHAQGKIAQPGVTAGDHAQQEPGKEAESEPPEDVERDEDEGEEHGWWVR